MDLPSAALDCIRALEKAGYRAYAVGGCVRDALLGLTPHDYDLCTDATPEQTAQIFADHTLVRSGEKHGTIGVVTDKQIYEITTFRTEGGYQDSRHPDWVRFVGSVKEDLSRRDFTVNAMAYSPKEGYIDPWGGQADLQNKILRCVGDPVTRLTEDPLRILRGIRFAVRFSLRIEPETEKAMVRLAPLMEKLARERVFDELCKLLPAISAEELLRYAPILTAVIPELAPCAGFQQHSPHHAYDVLTHTAHVVENCPRDLALRWAALLHDIGKPGSFTLDEAGRGHFHGHSQLSAQMADGILRRLKAPTALREQVVFLVEHHMLPLEPDKRILRRRLGKHGKEAIYALLALQKADFGSKGTGIERDGDIFDHTARVLDEILAEDACLTVKDLAVNGHDLMALGFQGPTIGETLAWLLTQVQDDRLPNEKETLLKAVNREETI